MNFFNKKSKLTGYTGYVPYRHVHFGTTNKIMSNQGLRDFTSDYLHKKRVQWAPVCIPKRKESKPGTEHIIYLKDTAIMPTYTGHIPGEKHR